LRGLRERLAGGALHGLLVGIDDPQPVLGAEIGVERETVEVLVGVEDVLEYAVVDAEHNVRIHLDEAPVAVVGEPLATRFGGQPLHGRVVETEVEDGVHHAGHGGARAGAHRHQQRGGNIAEGGVDRLADRSQRRIDLLRQVAGQLAAVAVVGGAHLGGDGEARRHGQAEVRHLGEVGALAAQQLLHGGGAVRFAGAEQVDTLVRRAGRRLPGLDHVARFPSRHRMQILACPYQSWR
jgi:hypothetical protein